MKLRVLGSAGAELPNFRPPAFLIDDRLLLDAGTIGSVLSEEEQWRLQNIFITHSHLDHIRAIPALADNIIIKNLRHGVKVFSTAAVISAMREHLFNNVIWPDFSVIPTPESPVISFETIETGVDYAVSDYRIRAIPVNHTVPAVGYRVCHGATTLVYTGDTGADRGNLELCRRMRCPDRGGLLPQPDGSAGDSDQTPDLLPAECRT